MTFKKYNYLLIAAIILLSAIFYWPSFFSPFFQDDVIFLKSKNASNILSTIPEGVWRPLSFQIFYTLGKEIFGQNPLPFHLVLFFFSSLTLFLIYALSNKIFKDEKKAIASVFFYAFNISLFANLYWVATSYFVLGGFFVFLSLYLYFVRNSLLLSVVSFVLALLSNELAFVLPMILGLCAWYDKKLKKSLLVFVVLDLIYIFVKVIYIGLPQKSAYKLDFLSFFPNFRWYAFRALNLPEGIKRSSDWTLFLFFALFVSLLFFGIFLKIKSGKINLPFLLFTFAFFICGSLPFFFMPNHMSSYYLTVSLFASSLIFSEFLSVNSKLFLLSMLVYFLLSLKGLHFLEATHWIILKNTGPIGIL